MLRISNNNRTEILYYLYKIMGTRLPRLPCIKFKNINFYFFYHLIILRSKQIFMMAFNL